MRKKGFRSVTAWAGVLAFSVLAVSLVAAQNRVAPPGYKPPKQDLSKVGGVDCASPSQAVQGAAPGSPVTDVDNTCGAPAVVNDYASSSCASFLYEGPELIYQLDVGATNDFSITLTPTAPADMGVFLVGDCATPTSCVEFTDVIGGGSVSTITQAGLAAGTYYIYIDSYYASGASSCGQYDLTVDGTVPVELMDFSVE